MSVFDPAMLNPNPDDEDSDWEYEYHDTETETFFLNLDLTTHHGPIRAPRRRNDPSTSMSASTATTANPAPVPSRLEDQDPAVTDSETDNHNPSVERVQLLGLHTHNPIISYQSQIFSGSWADQIGTELFFARPEMGASEFDDPESAPKQITPLKHTEDFDLISANSVKILGRKANLISSSGAAAASEPREPSSSAPVSSTLDAPGLVYKPQHQSNQGRFLNRLQDLKRRKGETDTVRTVFSVARQRPNLEDRLRGWIQTEEQLTVIQQLNDRAVQGDFNAVRELENIYSQLGSQDAVPSEGPSRSV